MEKLTPINKKIADFIYDKPEVVVVTLQQFGYNIDLKTATIPQINKLVFNALYVEKNEKFAETLINDIENDGQKNIAGQIIASIIGSTITGVFAAKEGQANREMEKQITFANLASTEKLSEEKIRAEQETARLGIMANTMLEYRKTLQKESTKRLSDTWLYVTGLGIGLGVLYGVYLIGSDS